MRINPKSRLFPTIVCAAAMPIGCAAILAQTPCAGYRVVARHYDAELRKTWELRQDCLHPGWPAHSVAVSSNTALLTANLTPLSAPNTFPVHPLLVRAGEPVRLWSQDANSRIEITGIAEQSARFGERINVRLTHQTDESGIIIQHIAGIVRGEDDVEIAQ
ncbi:MAG TPA: hypothetical protein VN682_03505 [Terriglobales bacterium]|nr:hypothetical protein [Terriglobales bacterium]